MKPADLAIVHFSDVHFGRAIGRMNHKRSPLRLGNGHDWNLAGSFQDCVLPGINLNSDVADYLEISDRNVRFVMSGDLTARGHEDDFVLGQSFIYEHCRLQGTEGDTVGLKMRPLSVDPSDSEGSDNPTLVMVEGNHDAWGGKPYPGRKYNPKLAGNHFRETPWLTEWEADEFVIQILGLNSNRGCSPTARDANAIGSLDISQAGELDQAEVLLADRTHFRRNNNDSRPLFRAAVVHHPVVIDGRNGESLDIASRIRISRFAEQNRVRVFLTGHTHDFLGRQMEAYSGVPIDSWELRSASTIQGLSSRQNPDPPGFLLHRLRLLNATTLEWKCFRWIWNPAGYFMVDDDDDAIWNGDSAGFMTINCQPA